MAHFKSMELVNRYVTYDSRALKATGFSFCGKKKKLRCWIVYHLLPCQNALSAVQTKAEAEVKRVQTLISEKDAELDAVEESLSGLTEVYYGPLHEHVSIFLFS